MSSKPQRDSQNSSDSPERQPLPFEPAKSRKQAERKAEAKAAKKATVATTKTEAGTKPNKTPNQSSKVTGIPDVISRRMAKRMAVFSGVPTALGMSTFVISYLIVSNDVFKIPTYAVLLVSLGFFGLGVLGLSYGALSASWDEESLGSRLGWTEFTTNWQRMTAAWKESRNAAREAAGKKS